MSNIINHIREYLKFNYDIDNPSIKEINHGVINSNYKINTPKNSYIFKIYNLRDESNVEFELNILLFLSQRRFPSPKVIRDKQKRLYNNFKEKPAVLLNYIPGEMLTDITLDKMYYIGRMVGTLHNELLYFEQSIQRVTWEPDDIMRHIRSESDNIISKNFPEASRFVTYISQEFQKLDFPEDLPIGMTHQDIKPENIILDHNGQISFIDFNDCYRGVLLFDVMTMVIWSCFENSVLNEDLFKAYLKGYLKKRPFKQIEKEYCYKALLFRLLRESFVWPMRFSPEVAFTNSEFFLSSYKYISKNENDIKKMISSIWSVNDSLLA